LSPFKNRNLSLEEHAQTARFALTGTPETEPCTRLAYASKRQ
jgi:hypothetical protein